MIFQQTINELKKGCNGLKRYNGKCSKNQLCFNCKLQLYFVEKLSKEVEEAIEKHSEYVYDEIVGTKHINSIGLEELKLDLNEL